MISVSISKFSMVEIRSNVLLRMPEINTGRSAPRNAHNALSAAKIENYWMMYSSLLNITKTLPVMFEIISYL